VPKPIVSVQFLPQFRDLRGRFARADKQLLDDRREAVRKMGRRWVAYAQDEAPKSPTSTGRFWRGIRFRTYVRGSEIGFTATSPQPLGTYIVKGTKPHIIRAKFAKALYFFWPRGGGKYYSRKSVRHPGTKPNPYTVRATKRWEKDAEKEIKRISTRWVVKAAQ
jgi:hypothetical protein